jgi:hypothetical protein
MASDINPNLIDGAYPVAGQDNNSQGFRDNFTNTRTNFEAAENEINDLQAKVILKAALAGTTLDNNMNDNLLYAAKIQDFSATVADITTTSGTVLVNYAAGHYQTVTTSGSITLAFSNFPVPLPSYPLPSYGWVRLQVNITNVSHTLTLPAAVSLGLSGIQGISPGISGVTNVITFGVTGTYEFEFTTDDAGTTITLFDLNRALTNFTAADLTLDDITATGFANIAGNITGGNISTAGLITATGNITGGNLRTAGLVTATGNITGGNIVTAGVVMATGTITGGNVVGFLRPSIGTSTLAPLVFTTGSLVTANVSAPLGGSIEYDGTVFYGTPTAVQRGVIPAEHFIVLANDYTATDTASAQKIFNSPLAGQITLAASTTYFFEGQYIVRRSLGTNAHTFGVLFATGGTLTSIAYTAEVSNQTSAGVITPSVQAVSKIFSTAITEATLTASSSTQYEDITVYVRGTVRTNSGGTFIPQMKYSTAPGGSPTVLANSFFRIAPVGTSSVASVGNWS